LYGNGDRLIDKFLRIKNGRLQNQETPTATFLEFNGLTRLFIQPGKITREERLDWLIAAVDMAAACEAAVV
jgi:hypothetical protein